MPEFSVVIPVYNAAGTLEETLLSVDNQRFRDFEVIIVDDGSTDESPEIIARWKENTELPVRALRHENTGLGASRNRGTEAAMANWVAFLDADDLWDPRKLQIVRRFISPAKFRGVVYHRVINFEGPRNYPRAIRAVKSKRDLLINANPLVPSATVIDREIALRFPFSEDRKLHGAEDLHLWVRLIDEGIPFHFERDAVTKYRMRGGMSSDLESHLRYVFNALKALREEGIIDADTEQVAISRKHYEAGRFYQKHGEFARAREHYKKGLVRGALARSLIVANRLRLRL